MNNIDSKITEFYDSIKSVIGDSDKILYTNAVASYLGISRDTVYKYVKKNIIPFHRIEKGKIFFLKEEIDNWLKNK